MYLLGQHLLVQAEIGFLARLSHSNIINLVGYCRERDELLIVYEFMEKGSLNYHLFASKNQAFSCYIPIHRIFFHKQ